MHHLKYRCASSPTPLSTGVYLDDQTLTQVWHQPIDTPCPACGQQHRTRVMEAYVLGITDDSGPGRWRAVLADR